MLWILSLLIFFGSEPSLASRRAAPTREVIVKKGESYGGVKFPEGTKVMLYVPGDAFASAELSKDFTLSGHSLKKGTILGIYENGGLFHIAPVGGQKIGELTFAPEEAASVYFTATGVLKNLQLRNAKEIQGLLYKAGAEVSFHPNGKVERGSKLEPQKKNGMHLAAGSAVNFYPSGTWERITLGAESRWGELTLTGSPNPANPGETEFWENGQLRRGILARPVTLQGFSCGPGTISFFESGKLQTLVLGADLKTKVNSYPLDAKAGDSLTLNEAGSVIGWGGK